MRSPADPTSRASSSLATAGAAGVHLPVQLTRFIGREREIAALRQMLGTTRLLTLTGAGGSGKTRLALEVAAQVASERPQGIAWVELASLTDPDLLPQQVATTLRVREEGGRSALDALLAFLRDRSLLLLLDNCEHLADRCAALADTLLRSCPDLRILATSREALGVAGERAWLVPPLTLPEPDAAAAPAALMACEAVQLFIDRARDVLPSFSLTEQNAAAVAQICRRLDGIPLAIELAAVRVKVLAPEQIVQRLENVFALLTSGNRTALPRHRTLRATIDWSYRLLSRQEQLLLQRLSVFRGGFALEAVEAVCADESLETGELLDLLTHLIDRSLVVVRERAGAARYHLLETVRQYADLRLHPTDAVDGQSASDARELHRRFAQYHAGLVESANEQLHRPRQLEALAELELEHENLRAALGWSLAAGDAGLAVRLCVGLREFWRLRGHLSEGRQWMREVLSLPIAEDALRARVLIGAADLARLQGDHTSVREHLAAAEAIARRVGDRAELAHALTSLGQDLVLQRDLAGARERFDEAVALHRELGGSWGLTLALGGRASVAQAEGDLALARALRTEAAEVARLAGDREGEARALLGLGELARQQDDHASAGRHYERSLALLRELGEPFHIGVALNNLAWVSIACGRYDEALRLLSEPLRLGAAVGNQASPAFGLATLAAILHPRGHTEQATEALAAARQHLTQLGINPPPADAREWERVRERLRSTLGQEAFDRAWASGSTRNAPDVLTRILEIIDTWAPEEGSAPPSPPIAAEASAVASSVDQDPPPATEPSLRVRALGALEIYRDGELLPAEHWRHARPKELLLYLLCHPEGRTKEQIGLVFWPDSSAAQVKNSFHVTLHHLRKALGRNDWIVFEEERYRVNPEPGCELDAAVFEEQIAQALREVRSGGDSLTPERLASILGLYRGDFLQNETVGDWHLELRDRLQRLWLEGMLALGNLLVKAERWTEGAEVYQQIVRREDLQEEAHRRLMLCWAQAGERSRALKHYERLVSLLREELDAKPEEETTALYERLKQAMPV